VEDGVGSGVGVCVGSEVEDADGTDDEVARVDGVVEGVEELTVEGGEDGVGEAV
jgi:hypothetical protein